MPKMMKPIISKQHLIRSVWFNITEFLNRWYIWKKLQHDKIRARVITIIPNQCFKRLLEKKAGTSNCGSSEYCFFSLIRGIIFGIKVEPISTIRYIPKT